MDNAISWYDGNAQTASKRYDSIAVSTVHGWFENLLPTAPATALDVGAGSGRDAAWLAAKGFDVVAVEPSKEMRRIGKANHPDGTFQWIDDRLPSLSVITRLGIAFDVILVSAVWMHLAQDNRSRAFRKLINLLKPGGMMMISLRIGLSDDERRFHTVSMRELQMLARDHGAYVERNVESVDHCGRTGVGWMSAAVRLPDDGGGALPLLRHIILNDNKSATYKLALLRALCRIADGCPGLAAAQDDAYVDVPLGLVALTWLRLYKPLLAAKLPQNPRNVGLDNLGFAKKGFIASQSVSHNDLRIGVEFSGETAQALHAAIQEAANTIHKMPATNTKYPSGDVVFPVKSGFAGRTTSNILFDETYLTSFGVLSVPRYLWTTLRRFNAWIEPTIIAEWIKLIERYAENQRRRIDPVAIGKAMEWAEPEREVNLARNRALAIIDQGKLFCTWSGKRLTRQTLDIDHCFPWTVWPCGDLWNLMPSHRVVNQCEKKANLPGDQLLWRAQERVFDWWDEAYTKCSDGISDRFWLEARSSLPKMPQQERQFLDIFEAIRVQRIMLKHDQSAPEWQG